VNTFRRIPQSLVKALAAGAVLAAAALPLGLASAASASVTTVTVGSLAFTAGAPYSQIPGLITSLGQVVGDGSSGTLVYTEVGGALANDGGLNVTLSATLDGSTAASGISFTNGAETNATTSPPTGTATASFAVSTTTAPGSYDLTVTDNNGTFTALNAFTVDAAPTVTSLSPTTVSQGNPSVTETLTGTNLLAVAGVGGAAGVGGVSSILLTNTSDLTHVGTVILTDTATSITFKAAAVTTKLAGLSAGSYVATIFGDDGSVITTGPVWTVTAYGATNVTPSAVANIAGTTAVTIAGNGFETGALVALACSPGATAPTIVAGSSVATATSITASIKVGTPAAAGLCDVVVTNPLPAVGGNGATFTLAGGLGVGADSTVAPTVTSVSTTTPLVAGGAAQLVTFTGTGFSQYTAPPTFTYTTALTGAPVTATACSGTTGVAFTCYLSAGASALADTVDVVVDSSKALVAALSIAGPTITAQSPASVPVGAPVGTVITLTGTGFTNLTTGSFTDRGAGTLKGLFEYVNATTINFVVTTAPSTDDAAAATAPTVTVTTPSATGSVTSLPYTVSVGNLPIVTGLTYAVGTGVGNGATAQVVKIAGTGFATGATVGKFVNGNGVADPNVTATVTAVTSTLITATIAVKAGDTNFADGYTVTNANGGASLPVNAATVGPVLLINAGPTVTSVSPATATANSVNALTITGTGFATGAVVSLNNGGTCGVAKVVSATSITVSCTFLAAGTAAVSAIVTNVDGGTATSAVLLPAAVAPVVVVPVFHTTGSQGVAIVGRTVTLTISGAGFYGQPSITSTGAGVSAVVARDSGTLLSVRVTVKAGSRTGERTFTVTLANGKVARANYKVIA